MRRVSLSWPVWKGLLWKAMGGVLFVLLFAWRLAALDPASYRSRDDGVITMSHAVNLVDHGFIGVEPSGGRVEGFSSPLQFWMYAFVYKLTGMGWWRFGFLQTYFCAFLMGFLGFGMFRGKALQSGIFAMGLGLFLIFQPRFLAWHGSGMENPWIHLSLFAILVVCGQLLELGKADWKLGLLLGLGMLVRLDSIVHVLPLALIWTWLFWQRWHKLSAVLPILIGMGIWGLYQIWRWRYFGSLQPNTGLAQGISPSWNLSRILHRDPAWLAWAGSIAWANLGKMGAWMLPIALLLSPLAKLRNTDKWLLLASFCLLLSAFLNPFLFGMTRLDPARTTTFIALATGLHLLTWLMAWQLEDWRKGWPFAGIAACLVFLLWPNFAERKPRLCCAVDNYVELAQTARDWQAAQGLPRITVAAPDLGKLSYLKEFNIFDIGFLGSPIVTRLSAEEDLLRRYFYEFALPDVLEVHGEWCLRHARILAEPRFKKLYEALHETREDYLNYYDKDWLVLAEGVFVRKGMQKKSGSKEWQLSQALKLHLDLNLVREALAQAMDDKDPSAHQYVLRTCYRLLPEFKEAGLRDELVELFANTPSAAYDQALLRSDVDRNWVAKAMEWLEPYLRKKELQKFRLEQGPLPRLLLEKGRFRVYVNAERKMWFSMMGSPPEMGTLHIYALLPADIRPFNPWKAVFMDFTWDSDCGWENEGEFLYRVQLPDLPIKAMLLGWKGEGKSFAQHIRWPLHWL